MAPTARTACGSAPTTVSTAPRDAATTSSASSAASRWPCAGAANLP